jgi:hypothetical protein
MRRVTTTRGVFGNRYGSSISTDVRATVCNPWIAIFLATVNFLLMWVFSPRRWKGPYLVNAAYLLLTAAICKTASLVHRNLVDLKVRAASWSAARLCCGVLWSEPPRASCDVLRVCACDPVTAANVCEPRSDQQGQSARAPLAVACRVGCAGRGDAARRRWRRRRRRHGAVLVGW